MAENLLRDSWADLDQADLRLLLQERIGRPGQYDGDVRLGDLGDQRGANRLAMAAPMRPNPATPTFILLSQF